MCWSRFHTSSVIYWTCEDHREDRGDEDAVLSGPDLDFSFFISGRHHICLSLTAAWTLSWQPGSRRAPPHPRGKQWPGAFSERTVGKCWLTGADGGTSGKGAGLQGTEQQKEEVVNRGGGGGVRGKG